MKKLTLILISIPLFLVVIFLSFRFKKQLSKVNTPQVKNVDNIIENNVDNKQLQSDSYVEYESDIFDKYKDKKIVLFFYANWCPTCKPVDEEISKNINLIPSNAVIVRVNYNDTETDPNEEGLARRYNITYQHTFVQIDGYGDVIKKWNGGGLNNIISNIEL